MNTFYTYLWLREDGSPYYVGKGHNRRGLDSDGHRMNAPGTKDRILIQEFLDEKAAFEAEKFLIGYYGRLDLGTGCLLNLTDGGVGGTTGYKHTEDAKKRIGKASSERINTEERRDIWRSYGRNNKGRSRPDAAQFFKNYMDSLTQQQRSEKGRKARAAVKNLYRLPSPQKGIQRTEEVRKKISDAIKLSWTTRRKRSTTETTITA